MTAQLSLPLPAHGVTSEDEARVHAYVNNILPKGVPTYVRRVLGVTPTAVGFVARVEIYDGGTVYIDVEDRLGEAGYAWSFPDGGAPFGWDERRRRWRRYPS